MKEANLQILIYGAGAYGRQAIHNAKKYNNIEIVGVADSSKEGDFCGYSITHLDKDDISSDITVVISLADKKSVVDLYCRLKKLGWTKIYYFLGKTKCFGDSFLDDECIICDEDFEDELLYAEMHVVDFCNLNCKGCTHFAPLFEKEFPDIQKCMDDVRNVIKLVANLRILALMGGEPFLNLDIESYITEIRNILPNSELQIVTNGLLMPSLEDRTLQCIADNRLTVIISEYLPTHNIIEKVVHRLNTFEIDYTIRPFDKKCRFYKTLSLSCNSRYPHKCISSGCVNIWRGKIACCPTLMYIEKFNRQFNEKLPSTGIYEIKKIKERGREFVKNLYKDVPLCNHCVDAMIDWQPCSRELSINDFAWSD